MKVRSMIYNKIFFIFLLLFLENSIAQIEEFPKISEYLHDKIVSDVTFSRETTWALTNSGLVKNYGDKISRFGIDLHSHGNLSNYLGEKKISSSFEYLLRDENGILWLSTLDGRSILRIQNNRIVNHKNFLKADPMYFLVDMAINENSLWILYSLFRNEKRTYKLIKLNKSYTSQEKLIDSIKSFNILSFFIYERNKYFVIRNSNEEDYLVKLSNLGKLTFILLASGTPFTDYSHFERDDKIYLLDKKQNLYIIDTDLKIEKLTIPNLKSSAMAFNFVEKSGNFFICSNELFKISARDNSVLIYTGEDFFENCFYGYEKIRLNEFDSRLWCLFGGIVKPKCVEYENKKLTSKILNAGVSIFRVN